MLGEGEEKIGKQEMQRSQLIKSAPRKGEAPEPAPIMIKSGIFDDDEVEAAAAAEVAVTRGRRKVEGFTKQATVCWPGRSPVR